MKPLEPTVQALKPDNTEEEGHWGVTSLHSDFSMSLQCFGV